MSMKSYTRGIHMANNQQAWVHNDVCPMEGITFFLRARPHRSCWHSFDLLEVIAAATAHHWLVRGHSRDPSACGGRGWPSKNGHEDVPTNRAAIGAGTLASGKI